MNEQIFEKAINTLGIAFMAGRALVALGVLQKKKDPQLPIESRKALEESLAFIKKASSAEDTLKQTRLSLSSLESFEAYTIALETVRSNDESLLKGRDFSDFLKNIEGTIEALLKNGNVETHDNASLQNLEDTRAFFSHLMHYASSVEQI
jgi:hypothetical protein